MAVQTDNGRVRGARYGVSHETVRELATGQMEPEAVCDLHGLPAEQARRTLEHFISASVTRNRRSVLVICGRGLHSGLDGPVLRHVAVDVLSTPPATEHVLAFSSADPAHGGEGAVAVLLKRRKQAAERSRT